MAFTPSMPGIRKSINVMSGRCFFQSSAACCPSPVSATTSMSASCLMIATRPSRTTVWSSATRTRITLGFFPLPSIGRVTALASRFFRVWLETEDVSPVCIFSRMFTSLVGLMYGWILQDNLNLRALTGHGTQDELTTNLINSFFHSYQSETFMFSMQVKSNAVIHKTELDFIRCNG